VTLYIETSHVLPDWAVEKPLADLPVIPHSSDWAFRSYSGLITLQDRPRRWGQRIWENVPLRSRLHHLQIAILVSDGDGSYVFLSFIDCVCVYWTLFIGKNRAFTSMTLRLIPLRDGIVAVWQAKDACLLPRTIMLIWAYAERHMQE